METEILIIRHAKSIANDNGMFGGITDYDLSQEGLNQADALALRLKDVHIDKIYSSPLKRTINTIKPTAIIKNQEINIVDDLREINVGLWEDILRDDLRKMYPEENKYIDETEYYTGMIGQEETVDVSDRMYNAILDIAKDNIGKTVVVTSHVVAIRAFLCKIMNIPFEKTKEQIGNLGNTSITKIVYNNDKERFDVIYLGK
jgi:probable phosphoglycerate mutase